VKAPFKVLFSNDTTNLCTCRSPFQPQPNWVRDPATDGWVYRELNFSRETLEAGVDETAGMGIDVHLLQPGVGWVPWWKSRVYPFAEHVRFMKERTGMDPAANAYAAYMAAGGDMVEVFVRRCRRHGQTPFVSFRLNDSHGHEFTAMDPKDIQSWAWHVFSPIHVNHPEWRIGQDINDWNGRVLNWAIPEVRRFKFAFIEELCEQYDLDGFELDFMRHNRFFDETKTPLAERCEIMNDFVHEVRRLLDRTARPGCRRWLCVRVPAVLRAHDDLGVDLPAFVKAGVDMVNLSHSYFTNQYGDLAEIRALVPDVALYVEMCHCTAIARNRAKLGYDSFFFRRTTPRQFWTTAHQAYARGADGLSTFNFVYYREHGPGPRGPFHEPPFAMHQRLGDPAWLARQPQHYIMGSTWLSWDRPARRIEGNGPHRKLEPGGTSHFEFILAPPDGGWRLGGRFRIQSPGSFDVTEWKATLNGQELVATYDRSEPSDAPYPSLLGNNEELRAWQVPPALLREGVNTVAVTYAAGDFPVEICFADLAVE
jgi:hypothetical protein